MYITYNTFEIANIAKRQNMTETQYFILAKFVTLQYAQVLIRLLFYTKIEAFVF